MSKHRIVMEAIDDGKWPLDEGWYGKPDGVGYINEPIYWRVKDKADAVVFDRRTAIQYVRDMRGKGYPCHAEPPIVINEVI